MYFDQGEHRELKVGVLRKRAQGKSKVLTTVNWKERLFVLTPHKLSYFEGSFEKRGRLKGMIDLSKVKAVEPVSDAAFGREYCFQVVHEELILYIVADSDNERIAWIEAIQDVCRENRLLLMKYHPGVFDSNKWTCCNEKEKTTSGCIETFIAKERAAAQEEIDNRSKNKGYGVAARSAFIANQPLPPLPPSEINQVNVEPRRPPPEPEVKLDVVVAIYDFDGVEPGDLSLRKGQTFTVMDKSGEHWWLAKNDRGEQGYIPSNYVRKEGLDSESWFHPEVSRQMAEDVLKKENKEGCFLVRNSSREGMYTLSVLHGELIRHYHIKTDSNKQYLISDRHRFASVPELVHYHQHNSGGLVTRLRNPPSFGKAPSTAGFGHAGYKLFGLSYYHPWMNFLLYEESLQNKWEIQRGEIVIGKELGAGQFGSVKLGTWRGTIQVAVKMMKEGTMSEDDFIEEAKVMKQFQHPHLVQLYGVCSEKPIYIVTEYMSQGCLLHYLRKHQYRLQTSELTEMIRQVASAMVYLESHNFIHRDLAARNCLVGENNIIKVADFGLARYVIDDEYTASEGTKFPIKWAALEVILYSKFSSKSDVWAYGILGWEVYSGGKQPYPAFGNTDVVQQIMNGYRLGKPKKCPENIYSRILKESWHEEGEMRPSFSTILRRLEDLIGEDYDDTVE